MDDFCVSTGPSLPINSATLSLGRHRLAGVRMPRPSWGRSWLYSWRKLSSHACVSHCAASTLLRARSSGPWNAPPCPVSGMAYAGKIAANALSHQPHHQLRPAVGRTRIPPRNAVVHQRRLRQSDISGTSTRLSLDLFEFPVHRKNSSEARTFGTMSGRPVVSVLEAGHCIRLLAFLPVDNVELDCVTFFERFVPVRLNR